MLEGDIMRYESCSLDWGVGNTVEDKDSRHDERCKVFPAEIPELAGPVPRHLLHTVTEPLRPEDPADGHRLEEADPEERHPRAAVEVHQLEGVDAALKEEF